MQCIHLNIRKVMFIVLTVLLNGVQHSQMASNQMDLSIKDVTGKNVNASEIAPATDKMLACPSNLECKDVQYPCMKCQLNASCVYGEEMTVKCSAKKEVMCNGDREFERTMICRYCYQTDVWEHECELKPNCNAVSSPRHHYRTNCSVRDDIICLGRRDFPKRVLCNWTSGYRWTTALALSITLGGFGADRFYLGHWQEGIGKLFSFGGLGVWTLIDVVLISLHYLGPADGSLYL